MKNELGIEVCCENCSFYNMGCKRKIENYCKERAFVPSRNVYEARIKELQAQLSNSMVILDEKEFIKTMKNRLEGWNICGKETKNMSLVQVNNLKDVRDFYKND